MSTSTPTRAIADYAFIGDRRSGALISRQGSVDWLCLPNFDSPACFAALLGRPEHGHWSLAPIEGADTTRRYLEDSLVLETTHRTATGVVTVTDVMPAATDRSDLIRRVHGVSGTVRLRHEWVVRPWYGERRPWIYQQDDALVAVAGPDMLVLRGERLPHPQQWSHVDDFDVAEGEDLSFHLTWQPSHLPLHPKLEEASVVAESVAADREWVAGCHYTGPWTQEVRRSLLVLNKLTHSSTGGMVAAPTTSLPETFGGDRNWDYRYCWLRDTALTMEALVRAGYSTSVSHWKGWLLRAMAGNPARMQIMYRIDAGHDLPERELSHLPGFADSAPVRIGNGAVDQRQTDVLGEVMIALEMARNAGVPSDLDAWALQRELVTHLVATWREPDHGLWEMRGPRRYFTHSRAMVHAAMDRALAAVEQHQLPASEQDLATWRKVRDEVGAEVLQRGWNAERNSFTQHYDTDEVDASLLTLPATGLISWDDPRFAGTIAAIEQDLLHDGLVLRYRTDTGVDGLESDEHPFLICCFWLVSAYARSGRPDAAGELMERLVGLANDVGLLAEESSADGVLAGNFPQAFSHLGLVMAAFDIADFG